MCLDLLTGNRSENYSERVIKLLCFPEVLK